MLQTFSPSLTHSSYPPLSASLPLCLSVCLSDCLSVSVSLPLSLCLSVSISSLSLSLSHLFSSCLFYYCFLSLSLFCLSPFTLPCTPKSLTQSLVSFSYIRRFKVLNDLIICIEGRKNEQQKCIINDPSVMFLRKS